MLSSIFHNLEQNCFDKMDFNTDSPLSTKAKRDKFVRQPLSVLGAETPKPRTRKKDVHNDPEETITPTSVQSSSKILKDVTDNRGPTRRSPRSIINATTSPPSSDFFTSSPITGSSDSFTSPQVSMINRKTPESQSARKKCQQRFCHGQEDPRLRGGSV